MSRKVVYSYDLSSLYPKLIWKFDSFREMQLMSKYLNFDYEEMAAATLREVYAK